LDLLLLKILALEPLHGWAISQRLKQVSSDVLQVSDGSLYPALHKLGAGGVDHCRMENKRTWPPREILFAHPTRAQTVGEGGRELAAIVECYQRGRAIEGGVKSAPSLLSQKYVR
jgi:hypothetical protein